jgi:hypothetical protein
MVIIEADIVVYGQLIAAFYIAHGPQHIFIIEA